jgi:hypothetical protein
MGEVYRVCAALQGKAGDNAAWFAEWNRMGERVALLADQAKALAITHKLNRVGASRRGQIGFCLRVVL